MNDQLKAFLRSLLYQLVDYRTQPRDLRGQFHDWAKWGRINGRIDLACELGLLTHDQWVDLHRLLSSASDCLGEPFPHPANAGPVIPGLVLHVRRQAVAAPTVELKPAVIHMGGYDFVDASQVKPHARDSANEKPEPVPAPTSRPGLRLLCLLDETGNPDSAKPVATMQPLPPRQRIDGQWPSACRAPLVLRDTQARRPSASVLVRSEQHRQANAVRTAARTL